MYKKLVYKGFSSTPKYDIENKIIYGVVDDIDGFAEYESPTLSGVEQAFRDTVDDYIDGCREAGISGESIAVRIDEPSMSWLRGEAVRRGVSVDKVASSIIRRACFEKAATEARESADLCPNCGGEMETATDVFPVNGDEVVGIPHLRCPYCGEITFTPQQLDMVFGYRTAQRNLRSGVSGTLFCRGISSMPLYSAEDEMFYGLLDVPDATVIYDSDTAAGLKRAFVEAVDEYLEMRSVGLDQH